MKAQDLTGKRFGRWTALRFYHRELGGLRRRVWFCICDCGRTNFLQTGMLNRGATQSCGCLRNEVAANRLRIAPGLSSQHVVLKSYKNKARRRGYAWSVTDEEVISIFKSNCHYCGVAPDNTQTGVNGNFAYNGIDRVDNSRGYSPDNVVAACAKCNKAKMALPVDVFLDWAHRVSMHQFGLSLKELQVAA